jgi:hypothetical protein
MSDQFVQQASPDEIFAALSNDTRVAILQALQAADSRAASFSDLRAAVGVDDPGQFNYHLGKLTGRFVAKTDAGYRLTQAGKQMAGALASGAYTVAGSIEPITLASPCQACGDVQTLRYEDETVRVDCNSCSHTTAFAVPPAVLADCARADVPDVASRYLRATIRLQYNGFCWYCNGPIESTVGSAAALGLSAAAVPEAFGEPDSVPWVQFDCPRCGATASAGLAGVLLAHPAVAGFYYEHGIDVHDQHVWAFPPLDSVASTVPDCESVAARVVYREDGDECPIAVGEQLAVVDV